MLELLNNKFSDFQSKIDQNLSTMQDRFLVVEGKVRIIEGQVFIYS